jgi:diadenosine tetraphosphate (Ap4A) HIT family hydrolase
MESCTLCDPNLGPILAESEYWRLVLNHNQRFLGACFWALRHHEESITALPPQEWSDLHGQLIRVTDALKHHFQPDHFNYVFLQNQDRHVHMHIYPRYAAPRTFAGVIFDDPDYPSHYTVPGPSRRLLLEQHEQIAQALRGTLATTMAR